ncbi:hypothetical protein [Bacillus taeanensis]|uniref:Uncharacterized protein n=1 Tax=Bacillus taeanensis TaxID=273032 RepID=A0A366XZT9_9BACI|nr:hypothetical protein [Bacillus taeanensis]RBW71116.1 hypothetical protein DS031_03735 [Bacillus taeanensis]
MAAKENDHIIKLAHEAIQNRAKIDTLIELLIEKNFFTEEECEEKLQKVFKVNKKEYIADIMDMYPQNSKAE